MRGLFLFFNPVDYFVGDKALNAQLCIGLLGKVFSHDVVYPCAFSKELCLWWIFRW
jgi:hypothetical protein